MSIKEIEAAITKLPAQEAAELMAWLAKRHARLWDQQIEDDLDAGRLEGLLSEVEKEYQAGLAKPL